MKKILLVMSVAILMALCSVPSFVKAAVVGNGYKYNSSRGDAGIYEVYIGTDTDLISDVFLSNDGALLLSVGSFNYNLYYYYDSFGVQTQNSIGSFNFTSIYLAGFNDTKSLTYNNETILVTGDLDIYYDNIPEEFRPVVPSISEQRWLDFYDWFYDKFGYYPREGSLIDLLRLIAIGDWTDIEEIEISYPALPTPTPTPSPIPVQTIFVPDGNGSTTIIYQYTDPTTGLITQSPYNPNIDIDVNCDCSDNPGNNIFGNDPSDPTVLTSSMLWADGFGVEISDNPLTAANDSQKSLADAASEYSDSVNVVSNSFNVLPFKWLMLVGLLGGILIIAGLIRTFLGG